MHIVIAGGSGFVGQILQEMLLSSGHQVTILTRSIEKFEQVENLRAVEWLREDSKPELKLGKVDAIVNLAGESINGLRWTKLKKKNILASRILATKEIIRIIDQLPEKPEVLVNASAVGYYGMSESATFTETSESKASDFLASVVKIWEKEAQAATDLGVRTVLARFGVILGNEGALPLMVLPYKLGAGGTIGTGRQWLSWVHVKDVAGMIQYAIEHPGISGPMNVTAPTPIQMEGFGKMIGHVLHRPHWLPVPSFAMKALLGEMSEMLLGGQRVLPTVALESGYSFKYPELEEALENNFKKK
ncbi:TIGR01777 family oxidoreductase [Pseudogracilibacillus auburnensis]|uniref:TIGR01777 family oxidoreductase n=1 Tax=Pseudogracilibacillus auburnensis TaxID=1494959 RepID=UPI001A97080B|nr:TIGR01777 family oxidoreductase [Pseudogracilibacillus auburnensis]MBO1005950.1 TIGR01777 family protein [Pseudogracilibacillus auburnensis]